MKLYARVSISATIISFDRDSYFWEKRTVMFACNLISQNCEKFVPQFSEPPLPSKIPGYAPGSTANSK